MTRARRPTPLFVRADAVATVDVVALLQGEARLARRDRMIAVAPATGGEAEIAGDDLRLLLALRVDEWVDVAEFDDADRERLARLTELGLAITDADSAAEHALEAWGPQAALLHASTRWSDVDIKRAVLDGGEPPSAPDEFKAHADAHGLPPPHFHPAERASSAIELPLPERDGGLYDALAARRTIRSFATATLLTPTELGLALFHAFGVRGTLEIGPLTIVHKASPSGGGLHPIEAYPLVTRVDDVAPGLYHYDVRRHGLELIEELERAAADDLVDRLTVGQSYFRGVHVLVLLTARFERSFWKYRGQDRAYAVTLMDAGHVSQTLQLVCADLGLGSFVTAAINAIDVDERLGVDGFTEGAIAACGFGRPGEPHPLLDPEFEPFVPRT